MAVLERTTWQPLVMRMHPAFELNADTFFDLAQLNRDLRLELSAEGDLIVMPPTGGNTGRRNAVLTSRFVVWSHKHKQGEIFGSSTGFRLPSGAVRSPDVSWVSNEKLAKLTDAQMDKFPPLCPEFVLELRSPTDRLATLKEKMLEYLENGATLGWLLDPQEKRVYVYTAEGIQELREPERLEGTGVLEGFGLELTEIG